MFSNDVGTATPIRFPSTANLNIDSRDRNFNSYPLSSDFTISAFPLSTKTKPRCTEVTFRGV